MNDFSRFEKNLRSGMRFYLDFQADSRGLMALRKTNSIIAARIVIPSSIAKRGFLGNTTWSAFPDTINPAQ